MTRRLYGITVAVTEIREKAVWAETPEDAKARVEKEGWRVAPMSVPEDITDRPNVRRWLMFDTIGEFDNEPR
jgi:hypothetical protein